MRGDFTCDTKTARQRKRCTIAEHDSSDLPLVVSGTSSVEQCQSLDDAHLWPECYSPESGPARIYRHSGAQNTAADTAVYSEYHVI